MAQVDDPGPGSDVCQEPVGELLGGGERRSQLNPVVDDAARFGHKGPRLVECAVFVAGAQDLVTGNQRQVLRE